VGLRIERIRTRGSVLRGGASVEVENNCWLVGDDDEVLVVDAPHDADAVEAAIGDRGVVAVVCVCGDDDHVRYAPELAERLLAPVLLHPDDRALWDQVHARHEPDGPLKDGMDLEVAGTHVTVLHTPGHTPGSVCLHVPALGAVLAGDTTQATASLRQLPAPTRVLPGHGEESTVDALPPAEDGPG
jgi:glyoxylase-like metal-dependent hydrolase (beta-lactamase superfamily II)